MTGHVDRRWTSADGVPLHARDYPGAGEAPLLPVICLHGLTRNARDFEELAPRLARSGRRVLVPDIRGRGQSGRDPNPRNYVPKVYARDIVELADRLGIARAIFIGTSMGGIVTMATWQARPGLVAAAIFNDVGPKIAAAGIRRILALVRSAPDSPITTWEEAADRLRQANSAIHPDFDAGDWLAFARRVFRDGERGPEPDYDPAIMAALDTRRPGAGLVARLLFRRLARRRPTLLVRGERSDLLTEEIAARMKRWAPAMRETVVPRVGHAPTLSEPEAVGAIDRFLAELP